MGEVIRKTKSRPLVGGTSAGSTATAKRKAKGNEGSISGGSSTHPCRAGGPDGMAANWCPVPPGPADQGDGIDRPAAGTRHNLEPATAWCGRRNSDTPSPRRFPYLDRIVDHQDAARTVRKLGAEMAPGTLRLTMSKLKTAWNWAWLKAYPPTTLGRSRGYQSRAAH